MLFLRQTCKILAALIFCSWAHSDTAAKMVWAAFTASMRGTAPKTMRVVSLSDHVLGPMPEN